MECQIWHSISIAALQSRLGCTTTIARLRPGENYHAALAGDLVVISDSLKLIREGGLGQRVTRWSPNGPPPSFLVTSTIGPDVAVGDVCCVYRGAISKLMIG